MDSAFGYCLLDKGNSICKVFFCLIWRVAGNGGPDFLNNFLDSALIALVSDSSDFALSRPLEG